MRTRTAMIVLGLIVVITASVLYWPARRPAASASPSASPNTHQITFAEGTRRTSTPSRPQSNTPTPPVDRPEIAAGAKKERRERITQSIDEQYGSILETFGLSPSDQQKLRDALIERVLAAYDANETLAAMRMGTSGELQAAISQAQSEVDAEIEHQFGDHVLQKVQQMLSCASQLRVVIQMLNPQLAKAGVPLRKEQLLPLALALKEAGLNTSGAKPATDLSGLTEQDERALELAHPLLNPSQHTALREALIARSRKPSS